MRSGFITGMVAGTVVSAALMSMYVGQNPREAVRMGKRMNRNMRSMISKMDRS